LASLPKKTYELVVIGVSRGGLNALQNILSHLTKNFLLPIIIVQHREASAETSLAELLQQYSALPVTEPGDKDEITPGQVYIAPTDYHLSVEGGHLALSTEEPCNYARPSIDILFETAAYEYGNKVIAVILTGANKDGAAGLAEIVKKGGLAIVQEPNTASSKEMPLAALEACKPDYIMPLEAIGGFINQLGQQKD